MPVLLDLVTRLRAVSDDPVIDETVAAIQTLVQQRRKAIRAVRRLRFALAQSDDLIQMVESAEGRAITGPWVAQTTGQLLHENQRWQNFYAQNRLARGEIDAEMTGTGDPDEWT